jgi:hypothetical protein
MTLTVAAAKLADRLWPNGVADDTELVAHDDALWEAYDVIDKGADRGRHVSPGWCVETGGSVATVLDEFVGGSD